MGWFDRWKGVFRSIQIAWRWYLYASMHMAKLAAHDGNESAFHMYFKLAQLEHYIRRDTPRKWYASIAIESKHALRWIPWDAQNGPLKMSRSMINTLILITMSSVFTRMYIIKFESGIISMDPVSRGSIEEEVHSALHRIFPWGTGVLLCQLY